MASADLREELNCSICLSLYTEPVSLRCGHNFCRDCIVTALDAQEKSGKYFCPDCREEYTERPSLEKNRKLCNIVECFRSCHQVDMEVFCTYCDSPVPAFKSCLHCEASYCKKHLSNHSKGAHHVLIEPTATFEDKKCSKHQEILKYYCTEDNACICMSCWVAGDHKGHNLELLNEASEKKVREVTERLKSKLEETESKMLNLENYKIQQKEKANKFIKEITLFSRELKENLQEAQKTFLSIISGQEEKRSESFLDLIRQLETQKNDLSRKINDIEDLHRTTHPSTFLKKELITEDMISKTDVVTGNVSDVGYLKELFKDAQQKALTKTYATLQNMYK